LRKRNRSIWTPPTVSAKILGGGKMADFEGFLRLVGERVREIRTAQGISQEKLGELTELSHQCIRQVEKGDSNWKIKTLYQIAEGLGMEGIDILLLSLMDRPMKELFGEISEWAEKIRAGMRDDRGKEVE